LAEGATYALVHTCRGDLFGCIRLFAAACKSIFVHLLAVITSHLHSTRITAGLLLGNITHTLLVRAAVGVLILCCPVPP
jgi:hypothetical protein